MRTTLTIEDDIAARLNQLRRQRSESFKQLINRIMRAGLEAVDSGTRSTGSPYRLTPWDLGPRLPEIDNVAAVLEYLDDQARMK